MKRQLILLVVIILLYLIPSATLQAVYGPSYGFLAGEDYWQPDGDGGWKEHGNPDSPMPDEPSIDVPLGVRYIPIFLPALVLFLFLFSPLSKYVDSQPATKEEIESVDDSPESSINNS